MHDLAVEGERLQRAVGDVQDRAAGRLVDAARLHADVAVLDQVDSADAVAPADVVEPGEQDGRRRALAVDANGVAGLEVDLDVLGPVGSLLGRDAEEEHVLVRLAPRVLQDAALVADVQQVTVGAVRLLARHRHRNPLFLGVGDELAARAEVPDAPRGNDADAGLEGVVGELEAHLVVALAGGAVGDGVGSLLAGDLDLPLGDQRPGDGGAEQVGVLVDGAGAQHRKDEVAHELLAQVVDVDRAGAAAAGLRLHRLELLPLAEVGAEGDDLGPVGLDQPGEDDGGIESSRVGEYDLLGIVFHIVHGCRVTCSFSQTRIALLHVQSVLRLVEDDRLRTVDDLGGDLLAAMRGQAVHDDGVGPRQAENVGVDLIGAEVALALRLLALLAHARPHVRVDHVGVARRRGRVGRDFDGDALGARLAHDVRVGLVARRAGEREAEPEARRGGDPGVGHVVAIAEKGDAQAVQAAAAFDHGEAVTQHLTGVAQVGEAVDHRDLRVPGQRHKGLVGVGAGHDEVDPAIQVARDVVDRLALAEPDVAGRQVHGVAAELRHADLESHARAQARLLEDHRQALAGEQRRPLATLELPLQSGGQMQDFLELGTAQLAQVQEVSLHGDSVRSTICSASSISSALVVSGGAKRRTRLAVQLMMRPASRQRSTTAAPGSPSSTPISRPRPRTSRTIACLPRKAAQPLAQALAHGAAVLEHALLAQHPQHGEGHGTGEGVAAERRPVYAGAEAARHRAAGEHGADGNAAAEALGEGHDVGCHAGLLVGEQAAGPPDAGLHLVEDEQQMAPVAEIADAAQVVLGAERRPRLPPAPAPA